VLHPLHALLLDELDEEQRTEAAGVDLMKPFRPKFTD
jgi:hypothetical protein